MPEETTIPNTYVLFFCLAEFSSFPFSHVLCINKTFLEKHWQHFRYFCRDRVDARRAVTGDWSNRFLHSNQMVSNSNFTSVWTSGLFDNEEQWRYKAKRSVRYIWLSLVCKILKKQSRTLVLQVQVMWGSRLQVGTFFCGKAATDR